MSAEGAGDRAESYRHALEAFFAGDGATAAEEFAGMAAEPGSGQQLAREYLAQPPPEQPEPGWEPSPAGLAVIGAAAVVGAGAYLRRQVVGRRVVGQRAVGQRAVGQRGPLVPAQRLAEERLAGERSAEERATVI